MDGFAEAMGQELYVVEDGFDLALLIPLMDKSDTFGTGCNQSASIGCLVWMLFTSIHPTFWGVEMSCRWLDKVSKKGLSQSCL